ncbi:MAG: TonB-dependent receptor [Betaproteobacteria bacterium]|nr:TonB-dependent receptor [Betaproteobacteria bacterium]
MKPIAAAVLAAFPMLSFAAEDLPAARPETIVVTATREPMRVSEATADVTVISREEIEQAGTASLPELLARQPGVQSYSSGGAGKPTGVYIRGASPAQSLILIDGLRIGSATSGGAALEQISLDQIDHIEIVRGPASALYGSDAIGGVIQIFTRQAGGKPRFDAFAGFGTYGTESYSAGGSGSAGDFRYDLRAGYDKTKGFSAISDPAKQPYSYDPDRDGYRRTALNGNFGWQIADGHDLALNLQHNTARNWYDMGLGFDGQSFDTRSDLENSAYGLTLRDRFLKNWDSTLRVGRTIDDSRDFNPYSPPGGAKYRTVQDQAAWQNDVRFDAGTLLLGADWLKQHGKIDSGYDYYNNVPTYYDVSRSITGLFAGWSGHYGAHRIQLNVRNDHNSDFGEHTTGSAGWSWEFIKQWQFRVGAGTAFRAPTFNDLYWPPQGIASNPDLRPEHARNLDAALSHDTDNYGFSLTGYRNRITDMIVLDSNYVPQNVGRAKLNGATLAGHLQDDKGFALNASVDWLDALDADTGKRLPRRAKWQSMLNGSYDAGVWRTGAEVQWVGARYEDAANTERMGAYTLVNLFAHWTLAPQVRLEARIDNLFDRKYETAWGYGTAGFSVFAGLRFMTR